MTERSTAACPGCGLELPPAQLPYDGYYNTSPACWSVYTEVLASEYGNAPLFGRVHQLTVDAYAVQHAGGVHPAKSIGVHLSGLHLVLVDGHDPPSVAPLLQRLASAIERWPTLEPPAAVRSPTVFDVALAEDPLEHEGLVRRWAETVWRAWGEHHERVAELVGRLGCC